MKLKFILTSAFIAGAALTSMAQTHIEGEEYYKADQLANAKELLLRNMNNPGQICLRLLPRTHRP